MVLNIQNPDIIMLVEEVTRLTGESTTDAVRNALEERIQRLKPQRKEKAQSSSEKAAAFLAFLEKEVWPLVPPDELGRTMTKEEKEEILGYGEFGV